MVAIIVTIIITTSVARIMMVMMMIAATLMLAVPDFRSSPDPSTAAFLAEPRAADQARGRETEALKKPWAFIRVL